MLKIQISRQSSVCSGESSMSFVKSAYSINSLTVDVFLSKSNARFLLVKVRDYLALGNCKPMEQQDILASIRISREKHRIATRFLSLCHIEEKDTKTGKVDKSKRTNAQYKIPNNMK